MSAQVMGCGGGVLAGEGQDLEGEGGGAPYNLCSLVELLPSCTLLAQKRQVTDVCL